MEFWMSSELSKGVDDRFFRTIRNSIEKNINKKIKESGYVNELLEKFRIIFIIRNDNFSALGGEQVKKDRGKAIWNVNIRLDYDTFNSKSEEERKEILFDSIIECINRLEAKKKVKNLQVIKDMVEGSREDDLSEYIAYYKSIQVY